MHKDGLVGAIRDRRRTKAEGDPSGYLTPRRRPVGIRNVEYVEKTGAVSFEVKSVVSFWWLVAPIVAMSSSIIIIFFILPIAMAFFRLGAIFPLIVIVACFIATVLSFTRTRLWVKIESTDREIRIPRPFEGGTMRFDRKYFGGVRLGYSIQTESGALKEHFSDGNFGLQALRIEYGPWGEDLPYLVNGYHATEIVLWMNMVMRATISEPPKAHAPDVGIVEEVF